MLAVSPFIPAENDRVALAVLDMQNGFSSLRGDEEASAARVDSALRLLAEFPAWAIEKACMAIRRDGVYREVRGSMRFDRQWPPTDSELVDAVRRELRLYRDPYDRCVALLTATVEEG